MGAGYTLFLITAINLLNYVDRWLIAAVVPAMQSDLGLSNTAAGFIMSAFMLGYFLTSPFFGYLADRYNRLKLIFGGTIVWSLATGLSGLGRNALQIFFARTAVGVGEASTVSSGQSAIADLYPHEKRNQAMAIFTAAIPVGSALGFVLGGFLEHRFGWRAAFYLAGAPGVLFAALLLAVKEPVRGLYDEPAPAAAPTHFWNDVKQLVRTPVYVASVLGYTAWTFTVGGFASWAPKYLVSVRGVPLTQADTVFGGLTVVTGTVGTLLGGYWASRLLKRKAHGDLWFMMLVTALAIPFAFLAFVLKTKLGFFTAMAFTEFFLFMGQPAVNVIIMESVGPFLRGTATAFSIFMIHLLGDFISPPLVGFVADKTSLQWGVLLLPAALFPSVYFYWKTFQLSRDRLPTH